MLIVIEGQDGVGKTTLTRELAKSLKDMDYKCSHCSFPTSEDTVFGHIIKNCLQGKFGKLDDLDVNFVTFLFSVDRFFFKDDLCKKLEKCDFVICDRYLASNAAYGMAKLIMQNKAEEIERFLQQNLEIEHKIMGLPVPDIYILLDGSRQISLKKKLDLFEQDTEYIALARKSYNSLYARQWTTKWHKIQIAQDGKYLKTIEIIKQVLELII